MFLLEGGEALKKGVVPRYGVFSLVSSAAKELVLAFFFDAVEEPLALAGEAAAAFLGMFLAFESKE